MKNINIIKRILLFFLLFANSLWAIEFTATPTSALQVDEDNTSSYVEFDINISSVSKDETIYCTVNDGTEAQCKLFNGSLKSYNYFTVKKSNFDSNNAYYSSYKFRVYSKTDQIADGNQNFKVSIGTLKFNEETTEEGQYQANPQGSLVFDFVNNDDGDNSGVVITPPVTSEKIILDLYDNTSSETGDKASFSLVLSQQPTDDVTISFNSTDPTEGTLSTSSITFTPSNWNQRQNVDIIGVDDADVDGNISFTVEILAASSNDSYYDGVDLADINIVNIDDDYVAPSSLAQEFIITTQNVDNPSLYDVVEGPIEILEGTTSLTYYVTLNQDPVIDSSSPAFLKEYSFNQPFLTVTPNVLNFDSTNYNVPQQITVSANDVYSHGDVTEQLQLIAGFGIPWNNNTDFNIIEDDTLPISFTLDTTNISEDGTTATLNISLDEVPVNYVNFTLESLDPTECSLSSTTLNFTSVEAITSKDITITGLEDELLDFTRNCRIKVTWTPSASDGKFSIYPGYSDSTNLVLYNTKFFELKNEDNDTPILTVTPIDSKTDENEDTASFSVVLNKQPKEFLRVNLNSTDTSEGIIITPSSKYLEFDETNWDQAQTVVIRGVKDNYLDTTINYSIELMPFTDTDDNYDGTVMYRSVALTNTNIDNAGVINLASSMLLKEGTSGSIEYTYSQAENLVPKVNISSNASYGTVSINDKTITYIPEANFTGEDSFSLYFYFDNGYNETKTVNVSVKEIPIISDSFEDVVQAEDSEGLTIPLKTYLGTKVSDNSTVTYNVTTSNNNLVNAYVLDGKLYVVPLKDATGSVTIEISATIDGVTGPIRSFIYTLNGTNDIPFISSIENIVYSKSEEKITGTINFEVTDDSTDLQLSFTNSNIELIKNSDISLTKTSDTMASFSFSIDANKTGTSNIAITATDSDNLSYTESFNITVTSVDEVLCVSNIEAALNFDIIKGSNSFQNEVTNNLALVSSLNSICDANITWQSSDSSVVDVNGIITQTSEEKTIMLTATITKNLFSTQKQFLITVLSNNISDETAVNKITFEAIKGDNQRKNKIVYPLQLLESISGKTITWTSSNLNINPITGTLIKGSSDTTVDLTATIGEYSKTFSLIVLKEVVSSQDKLSKDLELLTASSILGKNSDTNNILYDLNKPLPTIGAFNSIISWQSSNTNYVSNNGDVYRDANGDKIVRFKATLTNGTQSDTKSFLLKVLKNEIIDKKDISFINIENNGSKIQVNTNENGEEKNTTLTFSDEVKNLLEQILDESSAKTAIEFLDNIVNVYLNTNGSSQTNVQNKNGSNSSMNMQMNGSNTYVDANGNVVTKVEDGSGNSISLTINKDGNILFNITLGSKSTNMSSNLPGSRIDTDSDGNTELSSFVEQGDDVYKVAISTDKNGKSIIVYEKIDLQTGDVVSTYSPVSQDTPFPSGSSLSINIINGEIYISTTVPLDGNIIIK